MKLLSLLILFGLSVTLLFVSVVLADPPEEPPGGGGVIQTDPNAPRPSLEVESDGKIKFLNAGGTGEPLRVLYGGTGATTVGGALNALGAAARGANSDITSLSGLTSLTSSGTITFSGLTADRLVVTTAGGQLTNSITSANVANSVTNETGSGNLVFSSSPTVTTPRVAIIYGGTGATSTLTLRSTTTTGTSDAIIFGVGTNGGTEAMRIINSGNVGIGTTSPSYLLETNRGNDSTNIVQLSGSAAGTGNTLRVYRNRSAVNTDSPVVNLINDAATDDQPLLRLQQDAPADILKAFSGATEVFTINDTGSLTVAGTVESTIGGFKLPDGTILDNADDLGGSVASVFGRTGAVTAQSGDYATTDVTEGTNLYFTNARAQGAITGGASTITTSNLTTNRALLSDGSGKVAVSVVTSTELGYLDGVTSSIQTQFGGKAGTGVCTSGQYVHTTSTSGVTCSTPPGANYTAGTGLTLMGTEFLLNTPVSASNGGTGISSYTANNYIRALNSTTLEQRTPAQVRGDIGAGTGNGTVTSVGLSLPAIFSVSGSPVTTSGTLTGSLATQTANTIFSGPSSGAAAAPTFRALVDNDVPDSITLTNITQITNRAISNTSGTLAVGRGGTGLTSLTSNNLLVGNGTGNVTFIAPGTSGNILRSTGTTWQSQAPSSGYPRMIAEKDTDQSVSNNTFVKVDWTIETLDTENNFSTSTDTFTAPSSGVYFISASVMFHEDNATNHAAFLIRLFKNTSSCSGGTIVGANSHNSIGNSAVADVQVMLNLSANDTIIVCAFQSGFASGINIRAAGGTINQSRNFFNVFKLF